METGLPMKRMSNIQLRKADANPNQLAEQTANRFAEWKISKKLRVWIELDVSPTDNSRSTDENRNACAQERCSAQTDRARLGWHSVNSPLFLSTLFGLS